MRYFVVTYDRGEWTRESSHATKREAQKELNRIKKITDWLILPPKIQEDK